MRELYLFFHLRRAADASQEPKIDGPPTTADPSTPQIRPESRCIFVGGLQFDVTEEDLHNAFSDLGIVQEASIIHERGFGYVTFEDLAAAESAVAMRTHYVCGAKVDIRRYIDSKSDRKPSM